MVKKTIKSIMEKLSISFLTPQDRLKHKLDDRFDLESMDPVHGFLEKFCKQNNIESFFEVGTMEGKSLKKVVENSTNLKKIGSCDMWQDEYGGTARGNHDHIVKMMKDLEYEGEIEFFDGDSHKILPEIKEKDEYKEQYDLVFVDGDHSLWGNRQDLIDCWPLVKPGGFIIFDDITHPKHLYLEEVFDIWVKDNIDNISAHAKYRDHHGWGVARKCIKNDDAPKKEKIKRKIKSLKAFSSNKNLERQRILDELKDSFKGETCYILSCGPSLGDIDQMSLKAICDTNLTISVKQAGLISGHRTDIQLFNCCNVTNYPPFPGTMYIGQADGLDPEQAKVQFWPNQEVNVAFEVSGNIEVSPGKELKGTLVESKSFNDWTVDSSGFSRPFGPGIMYETVFFLLKHLGVSKIRTIGWDFQDPNQEESWSHFYEDSNRENLLNPSVKPYPNEAKKGIELTKDLCDWLSSEGVRLEVMESDLCFVHEEVPRFKVSVEGES